MAGYVVGILAVALARPTLRSVGVGLAVGLVGEAARLWASGHIQKTQALATGGPYAHTRNPLYVGSLLLAIGVGIAAASPWVLLAVLVYGAAFYPSLIQEEARFLQQKFGRTYDEWAADVPMFLPRPTPGGPRSSRFSWDRVRRNREWRTLLALPALAVVFWLRSRL
jgi:protein-S-isoprenylcysteine O-methyltransferase Ste14